MKNLKKKIRTAIVKWIFGDMSIGGMKFEYNSFGNNVRNNNFVFETDMVLISADKTDFDGLPNGYEIIIRKKRKKSKKVILKKKK